LGAQARGSSFRLSVLVAQARGPPFRLSLLGAQARGSPFRAIEERIYQEKWSRAFTRGGSSGAELPLGPRDSSRPLGVRRIHRRERGGFPLRLDENEPRQACLTSFPAWSASAPALQTDHVVPRRTPCFRVAFYRATRPVGNHAVNNSKPDTREHAGARPWSWVVLVCGCILFGILIMSLFTEQVPMGGRIFFAGWAAVVLGITICQFRKLRR
jgi:hypothetical protein